MRNILAGLLVGLGLIVIPLFVVAQIDSGGGGGPIGDDSLALEGWAWSSNTGWLSFNGSGFGVGINEASGLFNGYAWSNNIGWVNFAPASGFPGSPAQGARIAITSGQIPDGSVATGWARACSVFTSGCSGTLKTDSERGGWDGWIKLSGGWSQPVTKATVGGEQVLRGFAWGGDVIGWLNFRDVVVGGDDNQFRALCSASDTTPNTGQTVTFIARADNGVGPFAYCWGNRCFPDPLGGDVNGNTASVNRTFSSAGRYTGNAQITDSTGARATCSVAVDVQAPTPSIQLTANPTNVPEGGATTLTWETSNVTSCRSADDWTPHQAKADDGTEQRTGLTQINSPYLYTLTCNPVGGGQPVSASAQVTVGTAGGHIEVLPPGRTIINSQFSGAPANSTPVGIRYVGGAGPVTVRIADAPSRNPYEPPGPRDLLWNCYSSGNGVLNGSACGQSEVYPLCAVYQQGGTPSYTACHDKTFTMNPDEVLMFRIQTNRPFQRLNLNSPYDIRLVNAADGTDLGSILFIYDVGGTLPF